MRHFLPARSQENICRHKWESTMVHYLPAELSCTPQPVTVPRDGHRVTDWGHYGWNPAINRVCPTLIHSLGTLEWDNVALCSLFLQLCLSYHRDKGTTWNRHHPGKGVLPQNAGQWDENPTISQHCREGDTDPVKPQVCWQPQWVQQGSSLLCGKATQSIWGLEMKALVICKENSSRETVPGESFAWLCEHQARQDHGKQLSFTADVP